VILDAGPSGIGVESTIVAVDRDPPALLRPGGLARERIEGVLGYGLKAFDEGARPIAPGMMEAHYAPSVPLRLNADRVWPGEALLAFGRSVPPGAERAVAVVNLSRAGDLREAAANLFDALRNLEAIGSPVAAMPIPASGLGEAINDRLRRAATPPKRS
jgi:L-threonylcarbamoyladenylate synthase